MKKVRIEIHLTEEETIFLDKLALENSRSRKNFCETEIRNLLVRGEKKEQKTSTNVKSKQ
jgi:hypothetical protein